MQIMNQQREEGLEPTTLTSSSNRQKIALIDASVRHFRRLVKTSLAIAVARIFLFFIIFINEETFLCSPNQRSDGWGIIFYILASLMDFLVVLNDTQMLRFLKKESIALMEVKHQLRQNRVDVIGTAFGSYTIYLSISSIIRNFKFRSRSMTSISQTIRYLQVVITFYIFGNLALNSQYQSSASLLQTITLWIFLLSIYFSVFQLDLMTIEASSGEFVQWRSGEQNNDEFVSVKDSYIRRIRRPFQIIYLLSILLLLVIIILYFQASLFSFMMVLCIATLMSELVLEKHDQNRLLTTNLASIPKIYLTPCQIHYELTKYTPKMHAIVTTSTRLVMMLLLMAYFRSPPLQAAESFLLFFANLLLVLGQKVKLKWTQRGKVYVLGVRIQGQGGGECSICLLTCEKGQRVLGLPCFSNHVFHAECLRSWLSERRECPLCRYSLQHYDIVN